MFNYTAIPEMILIELNFENVMMKLVMNKEEGFKLQIFVLLQGTFSV